MDDAWTDTRLCLLVSVLERRSLTPYFILYLCGLHNIKPPYKGALPFNPQPHLLWARADNKKSFKLLKSLGKLCIGVAHEWAVAACNVQALWCETEERESSQLHERRMFEDTALAFSQIRLYLCTPHVYGCIVVSYIAYWFTFITRP